MNDNIHKKFGVIRVCSGEMAGAVFYLSDGQIMTVGRSSKCGIQLTKDYIYVSRHHCSIAFDGRRNQFFVLDTSHTGIYNEGEHRLKTEGYIPSDYILYLGNKECKLKFSLLEMTENDEENRETFVNENSGRHTGWTESKTPQSQQPRQLQPDFQPQMHSQPVTPGNSGAVLMSVAIGGIILVGAIVFGMVFYGGDSSQEQSGESSGQTEVVVTAEDKEIDKKTEDKTEEKKKEDTSENEKTEIAHVITKEELRKQIDEYVDDEPIGTPVVEDFDGDGQLEMIAEFASPFEGNGFKLFQQYFVYTNGTTTYRFDGNSGSVLYETTYYIIELDKGCHLACTTNWRVEALGGQMYTSAIYGLSPSGVQKYLEDDFCALDNPGRNCIEVTYFEEACPGSMNMVSRDIWEWNGNTYQVKQGIVSEDSGIAMEDGIYIVADVKKGDVQLYQEEELSYISVDESKGCITVVSTLCQRDDDYNITSKYEFDHRTFLMADNFKVLGYGGEDGPEEYETNVLNGWFGDAGRQHSGLEIQIHIRDGKVCEVDICS